MSSSTSGVDRPNGSQLYRATPQARLVDTRFGTTTNPGAAISALVRCAPSASQGARLPGAHGCQPARGQRDDHQWDPARLGGDRRLGYLGIRWSTTSPTRPGGFRRWMSPPMARCASATSPPEACTSSSTSWVRHDDSLIRPSRGAASERSIHPLGGLRQTSFNDPSSEAGRRSERVCRVKTHPARVASSSRTPTSPAHSSASPTDPRGQQGASDLVLLGIRLGRAPRAAPRRDHRRGRGERPCPPGHSTSRCTAMTCASSPLARRCPPPSRAARSTLGSSFSSMTSSTPAARCARGARRARRLRATAGRALGGPRRPGSP